MRASIRPGTRHLTAIATGAESSVCQIVFYSATGFGLSTANVQGGSGGRNTGSIQVPANAVTARIRVVGRSQGTILAVGRWIEFTRVTARTGPTSASVAPLPFTEPYEWRNILGATHSITFTHDGIGLGSLAATIHDRTLDPATSTAVRAGRLVRVTAADPTAAGLHRGVWRGTILAGRADYDLTQTNPDRRATIQISAANAVTQAANLTRTQGVSQIAELPYLLEGSSVPWAVNGSGTQPVGAPVYVTSGDTQKTLLDQVAITRDTRRGYAWVDRRGILNISDAAAMPTATAATLSEADYTELAVDYDTDRTINELTVKALRVNLANGQTGEVAFGPYRDQASIDTWGAHSTEITVQGLTDAEIASYAAAVLAANATPTRKVNRLRVAVKSLSALTSTAGQRRALLDTYDLVRVTNTAGGIDQMLRPTTITHTLTAGGQDSDKWLIDLDFATPCAAATPIQVPPPAGPTTVAGAPSSDTGWITPALQNGWVQYPGWEPVGYRRVNGIVYLRGLIQSGTPNVIFTLPPGSRPSGNSHVAVASAGPYVAVLNIYSDGRVAINSYGAGANNGWLSLAHLAFPADG